jgi:hypothetical protein
MINIIDAMHYLFTGVRLADLIDDPVNLGSAGTGVLDGVTVFAGLDRLPPEMPGDLYPYLVIEPDGQGQTYGEQGSEVSTVNLAMSVLIPGQQGALVGRSDDGAVGILEWMQTVKDLLLDNSKLTLDGSKITCRIDAINTGQFLSSDDQGVIYSRGVEMQIVYHGLNWTGQ